MAPPGRASAGDEGGDVPGEQTRLDPDCIHPRAARAAPQLGDPHRGASRNSARVAHGAEKAPENGAPHGPRDNPGRRLSAPRQMRGREVTEGAPRRAPPRPRAGTGVPRSGRRGKRGAGTAG